MSSIDSAAIDKAKAALLGGDARRVKRVICVDHFADLVHWSVAILRFDLTVTIIAAVVRRKFIHVHKIRDADADTYYGDNAIHLRDDRARYCLMYSWFGKLWFDVDLMHDQGRRLILHLFESPEPIFPADYRDLIKLIHRKVAPRAFYDVLVELMCRRDSGDVERFIDDYNRLYATFHLDKPEYVAEPYQQGLTKFIDEHLLVHYPTETVDRLLINYCRCVGVFRLGLDLEMSKVSAI